MPAIYLRSETDWDGWRQATRALVTACVEPEEVTWAIGDPLPLPEATGQFRVSRALVDLAALAIQAREPDRFTVLYSLIWRANQGERVLDVPEDPDVRLAQDWAFAVRADAHRMRTHLRFLQAGDRLLGWYAPAHFVLEANAQLIARRFPASPWSIVTPDGSAHWDGGVLRFGEGLRQVEDDDTFRAWWEAHGPTVLAEAQPGCSVPEAEALDEAPRPPDRPALGPVVLHAAPEPDLRRAGQEARGCHRCHLWEPATQTVFGEGPAGAPVMFVGEQPGDQEDIIGRPFVGPAGQMLDRALEEAGIDRRRIYITNAVKHFKFTPRGKRRLHQSPSPEEIQVCRFWLDVERVRIRPKLLVLMGGSGARAVLGRPVAVTRERGRPFRLEDGQMVFITIHPSFLLRIPDEDAKAREYAAFIRDLSAVRDLLATIDT
ncbi:MAG: UdgX family uracil-DNA binding protein [Acetobacteraceae bacterium]